MKLQKIHLFIILLLALVFCGCLGGFLQEGMSSSRRTYTGPAGNSATVMSGTNGSAVVATNNNSSSGIAYYDIPAGQQDLYILKSQIVPPVCPACPAASSCPRQEACPPCPACERCPEPAFECKKVPNHASSNENYLPRPVMADFSQFGM